MPNRKQIIVISVLGLLAFLIGYFKDSINLSIGQRAEVQGPIAPTKTLTLEEKNIVGTYERKLGTNTYKRVFLDNGLMAYYINGNKRIVDVKWSIVDNELHTVTDHTFDVAVFSNKSRQ